MTKELIDIYKQQLRSEKIDSLINQYEQINKMFGIIKLSSILLSVTLIVILPYLLMKLGDVDYGQTEIIKPLFSLLAISLALFLHFLGWWYLTQYSSKIDDLIKSYVSVELEAIKELLSEKVGRLDLEKKMMFYKDYEKKKKLLREIGKMID
jgi:hypothetical protein